MISKAPMEPKPNLHRYLRQQRFSAIGEEGQRRISDSSVLVCGCGALGSMIAERLARAGVGKIRIVDRDWVELSNLQRQTLFLERHAHQATPKAVAAAEILRLINSQIEIEPVVDDLSCDNIESLANQCNLLIDGTDNFETRLLINDYCIQKLVPWVHGGCLGASGQVMTILPKQTACFRCLVPDLPPPESLPTCDTAGVLGPAIGIIANWQVAEALKVLSGNAQAVCRHLIVIDSWNTECRQIHLKPLANCPACGLGQFDFLDGRIRTESVVLCGKNAVQLSIPSLGEIQVDLQSLAEKWNTLGTVTKNDFFVRLSTANLQVTLFRGGRSIIEGTTNLAEAKSILARFLGS